MSENHRIDKWLWSVRLFKTRSLSAEAVRGGKVKLNGDAVKPSKELKIGDQISFRAGPIIKSFKVIGFPASRVGAPLVKDFCTDLTSAEEYEKLQVAREFEKPFFYSGKGRPTKKDRRKLDERFGDGM
jgi:ribosome-associated heat shock protein Hsp15